MFFLLLESWRLTLAKAKQAWRSLDIVLLFLVTSRMILYCVFEWFWQDGSSWEDLLWFQISFSRCLTIDRKSFRNSFVPVSRLIGTNDIFLKSRFQKFLLKVAWCVSRIWVVWKAETKFVRCTDNMTGQISPDCLMKYNHLCKVGQIKKPQVLLEYYFIVMGYNSNLESLSKFLLAPLIQYRIKWGHFESRSYTLWGKWI